MKITYGDLHKLYCIPSKISLDTLFIDATANDMQNLIKKNVDVEYLLDEEIIDTSPEYTEELVFDQCDYDKIKDKISYMSRIIKSADNDVKALLEILENQKKES